MRIGVFGIWVLKMKNAAIKEHHLYNKAFTRGKRYVGRYAAVYVLRDLAAYRIMKSNPQKQFVNRLGLSVSKKLGGAVERNRAKRVLRAAYDQNNLIVISPRVAILDVKSTLVAQELRVAFGELGLLIHSNESKENL